MRIEGTFDGPQFEFDDPVTIKRLMVKELLEETTEDELDDILQVLIPGPDDKKRRAELIHAVFCVWVDRSGCDTYGSRVKWNDVVQMFQDIQCLFGEPYKDEDEDEEPHPRGPRRPKPKKSAQILSLVSRADNPNEKAEPTQSESEPEPKG
jgi:hypothetical protein